nr:hypothetical protein [Saccharopolyspora pogona]
MKNCEEIATIFQEPMTSLNPVFTIGWQLVEAIRLHTDVPTGLARERAAELLDLVAIPCDPQHAYTQRLLATAPMPEPVRQCAR